MAIPDFQSIMLPLLKSMADGQVTDLASRRKYLATSLGLSKEELETPLPSGTQPIFTNRVAWAAVYLQKSGLLARPKRGHYQITDRGKEVLAQKPEKIDVKFLLQFPEMKAFRTRKKTGAAETETSEDIAAEETPEESLEKAYEQLRSTLADEVLSNVKSCSPSFFEHLVVELLVAMGYGGSRRDAGMAIGKASDEGIDGIIKEDKLGLDTIYVQAKRWSDSVSRPEVQKFVGALQGKHARKGVFLTTSTFSAGAREYASGIDPKVVLIDGETLAELMIDHGVGVSTHAIYELKKLDSDYFIEE